jgi:hypothetical protein
LGTSVNSRIQKELLEACRYGFCIRRLINWVVAARQKYPGQIILALQIDYKLAYCCGTLHFLIGLKTETQLLEDDLAITTLRLTFGGAPCPFEWGSLSELIYNLANKLSMSGEWDHQKLHSSMQQKKSDSGVLTG